MKRAALLSALVIAGCNEVQDVQIRYRTMAPAVQPWPGSSAALVPPEGVVAQGDLLEESFAQNRPPATPQLLARGQQRFGIFCSPCHGLDGDADGIIVARGFPKPPSFHSATLRSAPAKLFFDAITNGYGAMYSYADRVPVQDRWAIVAYIRALQLTRLQLPSAQR